MRKIILRADFFELLSSSKKIDLNDYVNVCWDEHCFKILNFKDILKKVK